MRRLSRYNEVNRREYPAQKNKEVLKDEDFFCVLLRVRTNRLTIMIIPLSALEEEGKNDITDKCKSSLTRREDD